MEEKKSVKSVQEFEEKYFPEKRKKAVANTRSPYEFGTFLAHQAMDKYRLTTQK
jgi:hypothetical protein